MISVSLFAAYIAGIVALFAPCCISYLFPAYLGSIFRDRKYVLFMTLIYSLGILTIMLPIVLGAKILANLFLNLHDTTYIVGGGFMILVSFMALFGIKLPIMARFSISQSSKPDIVSTYILGIFSGVTSSCCAPVLIGVLTLSSFSPSLIGALFVGISYVLGMVTPLYLASLFIHQKNILKNPLLKKKLTSIHFDSHQYPIFISNLLAFTIFALTGIIMVTLAVTGNVAMGQTEMAASATINQLALSITQASQQIFGLNLLFIILLTLALYKIIKHTRQTMNSQKSSKPKDCCH